MFCRVKRILSRDLRIKKQEARCLICGKMIKNVENNKCIAICNDDECYEENYTSISDIYN